MSPTPWDKNTHYRIEKSETPPSEDGYWPGEPKKLVCEGCGTDVLLTEEPSVGVDDLDHDRDCPNRFAKSNWYRTQLTESGRSD